MENTDYTFAALPEDDYSGDEMEHPEDARLGEMEHSEDARLGEMEQWQFPCAVPETYDEIRGYYLAYLKGEFADGCPTHGGPLEPETKVILPQLTTLTERGFLTIDSQPNVPPTTKTYREIFGDDGEDQQLPLSILHDVQAAHPELTCDQWSQKAFLNTFMPVSTWAKLKTRIDANIKIDILYHETKVTFDETKQYGGRYTIFSYIDPEDDEERARSTVIRSADVAVLVPAAEKYTHECDMMAFDSIPKALRDEIESTITHVMFVDLSNGDVPGLFDRLVELTL